MAKAKDGASQLQVQGCGDKLGVRILDLKNRYDQPTSAGWADCCLRMYFLNDPQKHVFEIQLVHEEVFRCHKRLGAHGANVWQVSWRR